jgi:hypothetical protein
MLIFAADLHMKRRPWASRPEIAGDAEFALRQIVDLAIDKGADLLLGGDIFDGTRPDNRSVRETQYHLHRAVQAGLDVMYLLGNHDPQSWCDTSPELSHHILHLPSFPSTGYDLGGHKVVAFDYLPTSRLQQALGDLPPDVGVLALHQRMWEGFKLDGWQASLEDVPDHVKLVLVGDIHQPIEINSANQKLVYPGAPYQTAMGDDERGGVVLIHDDLSVEFQSLYRRPVLRLWPETQTEIGEVAEQAVAAGERAYHEFRTVCQSDEEAWRLSRPLVGVRFYVDDLPGAGRTVADTLGDRGHVFEYPLDRDSEQLLSRADDGQDGSMPTLQQSLSECVDQQQDPEVFGALESLIAGQPLNEVVTSLGHECGVPSDNLTQIVGSQ